MEKRTIEPTKWKQPTNQVIVSQIEDKFLISKKFNRSIAVISPFEKIDDSFISNFEAPNNRYKRAQILYNMIPNISKYSVREEGIEFDCVQSISESTDIFRCVKNGVEAGFIHFDITSFRKKDNPSKKIVTYVDVNPRLIFAKLEDQEIIEFKLDTINHKFKTLKFKAFSVILEKGFILCVVDRNYTVLYLAINNPVSNFVGYCVKNEISNIKNNISPLWPIFKIQKKESKIGVFLDEIICKDYTHLNWPILIKCEREINSNEIISTCIGTNINIS